MSLLRKLVQSLRGASVSRPKLGQVIVPRQEDSARDYPSSGLTPSRLMAILREADDGSLSTAMQLFEEMEEKDSHLYSVAHTRRLALTGLDWQIIAASGRRIASADGRRIASPRGQSGDGDVQDNLAQEAADYCQEVRGGLLRVTAMVYLAKNLALKDWMIFAEIFGMPVRIARYEPTATADEKRELLSMLDALGSNAAGIFSRAVELQVIESKRSTQTSPYQALIEFLNREMSKAWLGQTLTTDISGQRGSLSASQVHEQVRQDLLADDIRNEGRTIRRDLLTPMTRLKFGPEAPVPYFRRKLRQPVRAVELAEMLDRAVNHLGLPVSEAWARESLGIPAVAAGDALVSGADGSPPPRTSRNATFSTD